jgi:hypothetical protein
MIRKLKRSEGLNGCGVIEKRRRSQCLVVGYCNIDGKRTKPCGVELLIDSIILQSSSKNKI